MPYQWMSKEPAGAPACDRRRTCLAPGPGGYSGFIRLRDDRIVKGFVPTPPSVVDLMVGKLFAEQPPSSEASVLDPGCGNGEFVAGILRACAANGWVVPRIVGVELDPVRAAAARCLFRAVPQVEIRQADFLRPATEPFDFIIGNPPYVAITGLSPAERIEYRSAYRTATGRFDLYVLFFEQALRLLAPRGRLVFITPEKFLYVETARPLRELLCQRQVEELQFASEATFGARVTYPLISTVAARRGSTLTRVIRRDGSVSKVIIGTSASWLPLIEGFAPPTSPTTKTLGDVALRISCGVATGADSVFVVLTADLPAELVPFAHPTVSGRQIMPSHELALKSSLLAPYDADGRLLAERQLGALGRFLGEARRRQRLEGRTCVERKPWYAFHDNLPLADMLRPKLLCKDITEEPFFVVDHGGRLVPRHSVYYVVPADPNDLEPLARYLNSGEARAWLRAHCQRAANGFLRLQSHVLKQLPVPAEFQGRAKRLAAQSLQAALLPVRALHLMPRSLRSPKPATTIIDLKRTRTWFRTASSRTSRRPVRYFAGTSRVAAYGSGKTSHLLGTESGGSTCSSENQTRTENPTSPRSGLRSRISRSSPRIEIAPIGSMTSRKCLRPSRESDPRPC